MLSDSELAARVGIPVSIVRAIRAVESGSRASAVRFEPHAFHARTGSNPTCRASPGQCTTEQIRSAARPDLLRSVPWTPAPGRGSVSLTSSETNRAAFERARAFDANAAIRSTSWGPYQVLGGHLLRVRPENPVAAFDADPQGVGEEMFISWMAATPDAVAAARAGNVERLAELYNGSQRWAVAVRRALDAQGGGAIATGLGLGTLFFAGAVGLGVYLWRKR